MKIKTFTNSETNALNPAHFVLFITDGSDSSLYNGNQLIEIFKSENGEPDSFCDVLDFILQDISRHKWEAVVMLDGELFEVEFDTFN
jgi:hypothetical protein